MDYRYLQAFITAGKTLNFAQTADELNIAPSAVSRQIKLLEQSIGKQLFIRSPQKVCLTKEGLDLFTHVNVLDQWIHNSFLTQQQSKLSIGTLQTLIDSGYIPEILSEFGKLFPETEISVTVRSPNFLASQLLDGTFDVIFTNEFVDNELVSSRKFAKEELKLYSANKTSLSKLDNQNLICLKVFEDEFKKIFPKVKPKLSSNSYSACLKFVRDRLGVALLPKMKEGNQSSDLYELSPSKNVNHWLYVSCYNFKKIPPLLKDFLDVAHKHAKY